MPPPPALLAQPVELHVIPWVESEHTYAQPVSTPPKPRLLFATDMCTATLEEVSDQDRAEIERLAKAVELRTVKGKTIPEPSAPGTTVIHRKYRNCCANKQMCSRTTYPWASPQRGTRITQLIWSWVLDLLVTEYIASLQ